MGYEFSIASIIEPVILIPFVYYNSPDAETFITAEPGYRQTFTAQRQPKEADAVHDGRY